MGIPMVQVRTLQGGREVVVCSVPRGERSRALGLGCSTQLAFVAGEGVGQRLTAVGCQTPSLLLRE